MMELLLCYILESRASMGQRTLISAVILLPASKGLDSQAVCELALHITVI